MNSEPSSETPAQTPQDDILLATEDLFLDIAKDSDAPLKEAVVMMNARMRLVRAYEAALIHDREAELSALRACWLSRDIARLKELLSQYYRRRQDLAPQIVQLMNRTGNRQ
jgi:hypothetical protein